MLTFTLEKDFIYVYNWNISLYPTTTYITDSLCLACYHFRFIPLRQTSLPPFYNTVAAVKRGILTNKNLSKYAFFLA